MHFFDEFLLFIVAYPLLGFFFIFITMNQQAKDQVFQLLSNIEENKKVIPTFSDMCNHPLLWSRFSSMQEREISDIQKCINEYVKMRVESLWKTKWWQLFQRFYEWENDLFRKFRELNENDETASSIEFQKVWKKVEQEMFRLEWILTERMLKQEKWLDKVVESFYNIVYAFFPRYNLVE